MFRDFMIQTITIHSQIVQFQTSGSRIVLWARYTVSFDEFGVRYFQ